MARLVKLLFVVATLGLAQVAAAQEKDDRMERLERGEVVIQAKKVKGQSVPRIKATALVKAPPARVWAIIDKCDHYKDRFPRTLASKELWRKGTTVSCEVTIDMPFPLKDVTTVTEAQHTVKPGKYYKRAWKQVKGDFKINKGSWTLKPWHGGKHTVVVYQVLSVPTVPVPRTIQQMAQQTSLPKLFQALRKLTE